MEKAKTIDFSNRPKDIKEGIGGSSCPLIIFGDEKRADTDMKEKFNIIEDEKKD